MLFSILSRMLVISAFWRHLVARKKLFSIFLQNDVTSRRRRFFFQIFWAYIFYVFIKKLKIKKNRIQFLEHREVIWPCTRNINWSTFYELSSKLKKSGKNAYAYSWRHFVKKMFFFFIPGRQRAEITTIRLRIENYIRL